MELFDHVKHFLYDTDQIWPLVMNKLEAFWSERHWSHLSLDIMIGLAVATVVAGFVALNALFIIWMDRKVAAQMQIRKGPNRVGPFGLLQTIADTVKLLIKEDIVPTVADKPLFLIAPILVFISTFAVFLIIPFGKGLIADDLNVGVLYVMAVTGLAVIGILTAGWASNNKYSLMGSLRSAAQIISYEIPVVFIMLSVVLLAGSLKMTDIIHAQPRFGFILYSPLGFVLFLIATNAEINRSPFDLPEGESELVSGYLTEYSAMKFATFFLAEYTNLFLSGAIATTLFLGGWRGPSFLPPVFWFFLKTYFVVFLLMWIRWTFPRIRVDHLMTFCWKIMVPLALFNLVVTAVVAKLV